MAVEEEFNRKFIATEPLGKAGEASEQVVWKIIQATFANRDCIAYWRYPIFAKGGATRKEPDILILDAELGIIIIEIKSITLDQIIKIEGHRWEIKNFYTPFINPYQQAENQLFALLDYCAREPSLKQQITGRVLVALPLISETQWQHFDQLPSNPPILFRNHLFSSFSLLSIIQNTTSIIQSKPFNDQQWQLLKNLISGTPVYSQSSPNHWRLYSPKSRADILTQARKYISEFDLQQENIAKTIPPGAQRIRGIAGSGKTVILCQKAALMHLKYPDWDIALVFFSRSLYHPILEQLDRWLRYFSNSEISYDLSRSKLRVLHAWGGKQQPGLYSLICQRVRIPHLGASHTLNRQPNEALAEACIQLLKETRIPQIFDAILIDEAQDLIVNEALKFEGKQPFYWLAYSALRPVDSLNFEQRRLIWADDEAQSLECLISPTASELFGRNLGHLVTGKYPGGIKKSEILKKAYRTPGTIITAAHALGMGLLRREGMLTGMTRAADWKAMGYEVTGQFISGQEITLKRPRENSPNPILELWQNPLIEFLTYRTRQEELSALAQNILMNLRQDGLKPSKDILVIVLGANFEASRLETFVAEFLLSQGIDIYIPGTLNCNILKIDPQNRNPNQFWCEGGVTISRIYRAKGQEADMVYLVGLDQIAKDESNLQLRNQLFVALTRTRAWVMLSGIGCYAFYEEVKQVIASRETLTFTFQRPQKRVICLTDAGELLKRYAMGERNFQKSDLKQAKFKDVELSNINLMGSQLSGVDFRNAQLENAKLMMADLSQADLKGANLRRAQLMGANLTNARLQDADLSRANLSYVELRGVNLQGANLSETDLTGVDLTEVAESSEA